MLARALFAELPGRGHEVVALDRSALDVTDARAFMDTTASLRPDVVIQCAAYTNVDGSEAREDYARLINAEATHTAARACNLVGARLVYPSTDFVFDGSAQRPYQPGDAPRPINAYGRSKLQGERAATEADDWMIVRVAWLYGPERAGFVRSMLDRARRIASGASDGPLRITDEVGRPTWTRTAARSIAALLEYRAGSAVHHVTGAGDPVSRHELIRTALGYAGLPDELVEPVSPETFGRAATRPRYTALDLSLTEALVGRLPDWRDDLRLAIAEGAY